AFQILSPYLPPVVGSFSTTVGKNTTSIICPWDYVSDPDTPVAELVLTAVSIVYAEGNVNGVSIVNHTTPGPAPDRCISFTPENGANGRGDVRLSYSISDGEFTRSGFIDFTVP